MITLHLTGEREERMKALAALSNTTPANFTYEVLDMWLMEHRSNKPLVRDESDYDARNDDETPCQVQFNQRMHTP
jgi:hypothetical protein